MELDKLKKENVELIEKQTQIIKSQSKQITKICNFGLDLILQHDRNNMIEIMPFL